MVAKTAEVTIAVMAGRMVVLMAIEGAITATTMTIMAAMQTNAVALQMAGGAGRQAQHR
ncbi:hypothetical protein [Caballeronia sp. BCC1704]|uniref:hypothetical protein n=1 Tax=Caballeronia sp. BCC1704 TaxID=2676300 RepID=UPI001FC7D72A|nr:hypothetical protein [Caballeronia sp. BCC1704]